MNMVVAVILVVVVGLAILAGVGWWIDANADHQEELDRERAQASGHLHV